MKTSPAGLALIKHYEGFRPKSYFCPAGKPTIGYGHVILKGERFDAPLSEAQAEALLRTDLVERERDVQALVKVPLTQGQFDALVSFVYNVGADIDADTVAEGLGDSTLLKKLNAGDYAGAADELPKWCKVKGRTLNGLLDRRIDERALFLGA